MPRVKESDDRCTNSNSSTDIRTCYAAEKKKVDDQLESAVKAIVAELEKDAKDEVVRNPANAQLLRRTTLKLTKAGETWKLYRNEYCSAVMESFTGALGGRTAYERCAFQLSDQKLLELRKTFSAWAAK